MRKTILGVLLAAAGVLHACTGEEPERVAAESDAGNGGDGSGTGNGDSGADGADGAGGPCANGKKDGDETDVDCGGSCGPCEPDSVCKVDADCATKKCGGGFCQLAALPSWTNGQILVNPVKLDGGAAVKAGRMYFCTFRVGALIHAIGGLAYDDGVTFGLSASDQYFDAESNGGGFVDSSMTGLPPRKLSACTVGPNGKLYLFGGENSAALSQATWLRNATPADAPWNSALVTDLAKARRDFAVALGPDNKIYAFGGQTEDNGDPQTIAPTNAIEAFVTTTGWSTIGATIAQARFGLGAVIGADKRIYVLGGQIGGQPVKIVEAFDTMTGTIAARADMPTPREHFAAVAAPDGRIYAIAGRTVGGVPAGGVEVEAYSPVSNTWTAVTSLPSGRVGHSAVVAPNGQIWVIGGANDLQGTTLHTQIVVYGPSLAVSTPLAARGTAIDVTGTAFAPSSTVQLYLDDKNTPIATGSADASGVLPTTSFKIPSTTGTGGHAVLAIDSASRYPVTIKIDVN